MALPLIEKLLAGGSEELQDIAKNEAILVGFLTLAKRIDDLPDIGTRFYEDSISLYQVISSGRDIDELVNLMAEFFGEPAKAQGDKLPTNLRFDPCVKVLKGIRKDQVFFQKKIKTGSYYGALWPWERDPDEIVIHLGYCSPSMSEADYNRFCTLVKKFLSKQKIEEVSAVGGQIHGISLPSFLQMSEMEGATYTLRVTSDHRMGYLYLDGGNLIGARYEGYKGSEAAYRIISWDNASIQIETADADREREIQEPLMHVMMESLKIKDEGDLDEPPPPPRQPPQPVDQTLDLEMGMPLEMLQDESLAIDEQVLEPMLVDDVQDPQPFEKAVDNSVGRQNQMSRQTKLLILLCLVILFAISVVGTGKFIKYRQTNQRYENLLTQLSAESALDGRIVLLMKYLKNFPDDRHRDELEERLKETNLEIEKLDYQKTIEDVDQLPLDERYENKALSLYTVFLAKYPDSTYGESIKKAMDGIRQKMATTYFADLNKIPSTDFTARYRAYQGYLAQFPKAVECESVNRMLADLGEQVAQVVEKKATVCDSKRNWDDCLSQCDRFLGDFPNLPTVEAVRAVRETMQDKKDLADLIVKAELAGDDYKHARQVYTDYLAKRPKSTQKDAILARLDELEGEVDQKSDWEKTKAYADNPANDVEDRIRRLETYIQKNQSSPYTGKARTMIDRLQPEIEAAERARREKERQLQLQARRQAAKLRQSQDVQRLKSARAQVSRQLKSVDSRYIDNGDGTVTDRITGHTWCQLDSYLELGRCVSYQTAKIYVQQLNTGNHSNWRLPTAGELAGIYKSHPYFPDSGADWYWSSDSFARGYHRVVDVVTSEPETVFSRVSKNEEACGHVRAVR